MRCGYWFLLAFSLAGAIGPVVFLACSILLERKFGGEAPMNDLKTAPLHLNLLELGWLLAILVEMLRVHPFDEIGRGIWEKQKAAAISLGVEWRYGELPPLKPRGVKP